jgi:TetR/AcrR family transcriptional regulator, regulator of biofilm formation and stress response
MSEQAPPRRSRRFDPDRRERIVEAALAVIAAEGVAGITHRKVAQAADVPLGSMTYHFSGMGDLVRAAFARHSEIVAERFDRRMAAVTSREDAIAAVVAIITDDVFLTPEDAIVTHELYTVAARDASYRDLTNAWMRRSRTALERAFDPQTARVIDAMIEGLTIHRALDNAPVDDTDVAFAVHRLASEEML